MKNFEIFKTGKHTANDGTTLEFTDDVLRAIADAYRPDLSEAPIVVGHPKMDIPAYGWIKSLTYSDGRLIAEPDQVEPQFSDLVKEGRFKKRSAAFFAPNSPNNPTPGQYYLRHVGFLGASAPAVKGLKPVEFADDATIVEFADFFDPSNASRIAWGFDNVAQVVRRFRDYLIGDKGLDVADTIIPDWTANSLAETASTLRTLADEARGQPSISYTDPGEDEMSEVLRKELERREAEIKAREEALNGREIQFSDRETALANDRRVARAAEDAAFVTSIVEAGRLPIGLKAVATALFADLADTEITFADTDGDKTISPRDGFRQLLESLPVPVVSGEVAEGDGPDFADPQHVATAINMEIAKAAERGEALSPAVAAMRLTSKR